jgi:uncharacterized protein (TIGR02271 family)
VAAIDMKKIKEGMDVYTPDNQRLGTIDTVDDNGIRVQGQYYDHNSITRVERNNVYLSGASSLSGASRSGQYARGAGAVSPDRDRMDIREAEGEIRVPEVEERLEVDKRDVNLGAVGVRRTVEEERQSVPVELTREEVHVERRDVPNRPIAPGEAAGAFESTTIRVPVRGEEAVARKEAVVTGEVVIDKERTTERQNVTDTVRKTHVDVDKDFQRARSDFERHFAGSNQAGNTRTFQHAEPNYRRGFEAAHDERYYNRRFEDVEPDLRSEYERTTTTRTGTGADPWDRLREEVREGFDRARRR